MEEIYNGLYQVQEALVDIDNELMTAAVCNQSGKVQFIVQLMHNKEGQFAAFFHKDIREYQQRIKAEEYILEMAETEEDMDEIEALRQGIQIIFVPLQFIPESQKTKLRELGITRKKKKLYPLILSLNDSKLLTRNIKGTEVTLCQKVVNWLTQEGNLALLASISKTIEKNTLPKICYNQKTKKSICENGDMIQVKDEISYEEFIGYKGEKPKLYIPEFSVFRLKKNIQLTVPVTFEIRLMFSPTHFYGKEEKKGPQYILVVASDEEVIMIEPLDELDPRHIQHILMELYMELQFIPVRWVTRGIFAPFLKDSLDPLMSIFKLEFHIGTEESIIDTYSFEHLYHLMTSDSPFLDFEEFDEFDELDEYDEFDDYNLSNDIQGFLKVSTDDRKDEIVDVELEAFQRAVPFAIEFMEKNPHSSLKDLEKYLIKKQVNPKMILSIIRALSEGDYPF
ncbi:hypothetical protein ACWOA2_06645 [Granulicatella elegans]|uniref:Uncharacterized protein n=1 Tax=Granulicatella elegans ATCC 700633 TaxID=626369 RepID=D0BNL8_9LACT|nr:hypothetical protein [Granulicatella elegans]EEW92361.1 hypothetical protein HMPREF0446_01553 [Granulicatella elegans ATCC 700633]